jgi:FkbM family methyltransferase
VTAETAFRCPPHLAGYYFTDEKAVRDAYWHPQAGQMVIDVGSSMGNYAMPALMAGAAVLAVDPNAAHLATLREVAASNDADSRLTTACTALFDADGYPEAMRAALAASVWWDRAPQPGAKFTTLDRLAAEHALDRVDWIKMDVEGAELGILRSGRDTLARHHPRLYIEDHTLVYPFVAEMDSSWRIRELLAGLGYTVQEVPYEGLGCGGPRSYLIAAVTP